VELERPLRGDPVVHDGGDSKAERGTKLSVKNTRRAIRAKVSALSFQMK
jgi:hypothetical protein